MTHDPDLSRDDRDDRDDHDDCPRTLADLSELRETLPEPVRRRASRSPRIDPHATTEEAIEVIRKQTRKARRLANSLRRENQQHENRKQTNK